MADTGPGDRDRDEGGDPPCWQHLVEDDDAPVADGQTDDGYGPGMATGRCLCGAVTYELGDVMATVVCHCDHCQRQSGSAFSLNLITHTSQLTIDGELRTYVERGENGDDEYVYRKFCGTCGSPIVSELAKTDGVVAVKAGTLDDRSGVVPTVEVWCEKRQPWAVLPGMVASLDRE